MDEKDSLAEKLWKDQKYNDCVWITSDGTRLPARRAVLSLQSDYLRQLLPDSVTFCELRFPKIDTDIAKVILRMLYVDEFLLAKATPDTSIAVQCANIAVAANTLRIRRIEDAACELMGSEMQDNDLISLDGRIPCSDWSRRRCDRNST